MLRLEDEDEGLERRGRRAESSSEVEEGRRSWRPALALVPSSFDSLPPSPFAASPSALLRRQIAHAWPHVLLCAFNFELYGHYPSISASAMGSRGSGSNWSWQRLDDSTDTQR